MGSEGEITKYSIVFHRMNYSSLTPILQMFHWPAQTVHLTRKMEAHYCNMVHNKRSSTQYRTNSTRKLRLPSDIIDCSTPSLPLVGIYLYSSFYSYALFTLTSSLIDTPLAHPHTHRHFTVVVYVIVTFVLLHIHCFVSPSGGPLTLFHPPFYQDHPESYHNG